MSRSAVETPNYTIPGVPIAYRELDQPWRVGAVLDGNNPLTVGDPWQRFQFVNPSDSAGKGFEVVGIDEAEQLEEQQARQRLGRFAGQSIGDAFFLIPPEGVDFSEVYSGPAEVVQGEVLPKQITAE